MGALCSHDKNELTTNEINFDQVNKKETTRPDPNEINLNMKVVKSANINSNNITNNNSSDNLEQNIDDKIKEDYVTIENVDTNTNLEVVKSVNINPTNNNSDNLNNLEQLNLEEVVEDYVKIESVDENTNVKVVENVNINPSNNSNSDNLNNIEQSVEEIVENYVTIKNVKDTVTIQNVEDTVSIQNVEDTVTIQNDEVNSTIQNLEETVITQNQNIEESVNFEASESLLQNQNHTQAKNNYKNNKKNSKNKNSQFNPYIPLKSNFSYLCVDILNYSHLFFNIKDHWKIDETTKKVERFVKCCRQDGYEPVIFIDGFSVTEEANEKWRNRREEEIRKGEQGTRVPQCTNKIFFELFKECGVEVHFSIEADNDDTLAAFAHYYQAYVLSADRDFLRYRGYQYYIYKSFYYNKGRIQFEDQLLDKPKLGVSYRDIFTDMPMTGTEWKDYMLIRLDENNLKYIRGATTYYVNKLGNPHITIKELRRSLYHLLGLQENILEEFPNWDFESKKVYWYEETTNSSPDMFYRNLLLNPEEAIKHFFPDLTPLPGVNALLWQNHIYTIHVIIFELCSVATKTSLVNLIRNSKYLVNNLRGNSLKQKVITLV